MSYIIAISLLGRSPLAPLVYCSDGASDANGRYAFHTLFAAIQAADDAARHFPDTCYAVFSGFASNEADRLPDADLGRAIHVPSLSMAMALDLGWAARGDDAASFPSTSAIRLQGFAQAYGAGPVSLDRMASRLAPSFNPFLDVISSRAAAAFADEYVPSPVVPLAVAAAAVEPVAPAPAAGVDLSPVFEVRSGVLGTNRDDWSAVMEFDNGKAAGAWVGQNKAGYAANGKSLVIVKVERSAAVVDWREREAARLASGEYVALPDGWQEEISSAYPDHFPHIAKSDKRKVAFTETASAGERDKQKVLGAAAYAERFFNGAGLAPLWYGSRRDAFVGAMMGNDINVLLSPLGDVDAMIRCYRDTEDGPAHGCMSYAANHFSTDGRHPVEVYALGGDIQFAMVRSDEPKAETLLGSRSAQDTFDRYGGEDGPSCRDSCCRSDVALWEAAKAALAREAAGDAGDAGDVASDAPAFLPAWDSHDYPVLARCLVWADRKQYGRVYGDAVAARMLRTGLEALGYSSGSLSGAKLGKVEVRGSYLMPYLDIGGGNFGDYCDDFFRVGGDYDGNSTNGLADAECNSVECDHCGDDVDGDDTRSVATGHYDSESWCECCVENSAFYCEETHQYVTDNRLAEYINTRGHTVLVADWAIERGDVDVTLCRDGEYREDAATCDDCGDGFPRDDLGAFDADGSGDCLCSDCGDTRQADVDAEAALLSPELPLSDGGEALAIAA
jgi:hypothetical protein